MNRTRARFAPFATLLLMTGACVHHPESPPAPGMRPPLRLMGMTAFETIPDPDPATLPEDVEFISPRAQPGNAPPVYPPRLVAARYGDATIAVRIVVSTSGSVSSIDDSPLMNSRAGPMEEEFRDAVEAAVSSWRFHPGKLRRVEKGEDYDLDGAPDFTRVLSSENIPVYLDIRFDFSIVEGRGAVSTTLDRT